LMMASIFFTERLPGISELQIGSMSHEASSGLILASGNAPECPQLPRPATILSRLANRLPQKQGLCQVVNASDFGTLSDF
jgi:hypothetical protein